MCVTVKEFKEAISIIKFEIADDFRNAINVALSTGESDIAFKHKEKDYHYHFKKSPIEAEDIEAYGTVEGGFKLQVFFNSILAGHLYLTQKDSNEGMSQEDSCFVLDFIETQLISYGFSIWLSDNTKDPAEYDSVFEYIDATNELVGKVGYTVGVLTDGSSFNYTIVKMEPLEVITQVVISSKIDLSTTDDYTPMIIQGTVEGLLKKLFTGVELDEFTFRFPIKE